MKKICFFMETPFSVGGEQRVVTTLANYFVAKDYEVYFILTDENKKINYDLYELNKKVKIIFIQKYNNKINILIRKFINILKKINNRFGVFKNNLFILKNFYCNFIDKKILLNEFDKYKFDYVIGVASKYTGILSILNSNQNHTKFIGWQHSSFEAYFKTKKRRFFEENKFVEYMLDNLDNYVVQTNDDKNKIKENFGKVVTVIGNPNTFTSNEKSDLINKRFIAAGRFSFVKNFDMLIKAYNLFNKANSEWELYIFGEGEEKKHCEELIKEYNLENKIFLPGKAKDMKKEYLNSSIYLMSSQWEGWGMVVTEAMSFGLPVISFDLPCIREIFGDSTSGIIIEKYNIEKFSNAMIDLANNPEKSKEMSKNALNRVKKFDIKIIGEMWERTLKLNERRF